MFLFHDWLFLHVCNLHENVLFSTLILGSIFSDLVAFYRLRGYQSGFKYKELTALKWFPSTIMDF